ncbi:MAG: sulfite exporter TauE/SafE family protein [Thermoguttaceae bacterium]|jgi:uncharacterized membrane protein YfcA
MSETVLLCVLILAVAVVFSAVGHAGASGYLAAMALVGVAPEVMRPSALLLNILVATIGTMRFYRAGCLPWPVFLPFAVGSIPLAFLGGVLSLPGSLYARVVGLILLFAAYRLFRLPNPSLSAPATRRPVLILVAVASGAGIGLLSGLTGTGGGIFLSPLLLLTGWAETRETAGISAAFVLVNSVAGIAGHLACMSSLPTAIPYWAASAAVGGIIGSELGARRLGNVNVRRLLALVLTIAGVKLLLT